MWWGNKHMLTVVLWKWKQSNFRETYTYEHVNIMTRMLSRHLSGAPHRIVCVTDDPYGVDPPATTFPLWEDHSNIANITGRHLPSCYRRLKLFDYKTQKELGVRPGDRIISIDLDSIVLQDLKPVLEQMDKSAAIFSGWGVRGTYHQRVFNGSFWSFRAGEHLQYMWSAFDPMKSPREALTKGFLGSDQGWISMHMAKRSDVCSIQHPEFASYPREVRRTGVLDRRTRVVFFHGARKPWHPEEKKSQPWISREWRRGP